MELNVISPIAGTPTPLVVCDEVPNNGFADFDLLDPDLLDEIINGQTDMAVTFHLLLSEAEAGIHVDCQISIHWYYTNYFCKTPINHTRF